jgi:antitoxin component YwqK of YwqJK toxin-antitoxin module
LIKLFALLLLVTLFISCNNSHKIDSGKLSNPLIYKEGLLYTDSLSATPFTGRHRSRVLDMTVEYEVVNGIREGDFILYFSNNNIQMVGKIKDNKNIGEWKYYFPGGTLQTSGFFENDIPSGKWIWYNKEGMVLEEGDFLNGNREGEWKSYDSTGRLDIVKLYKDNNLIDSTKAI